MSTVEETRMKSMFIMHFVRHNNFKGKLIIYQFAYEIFDIIMKIGPIIIHNMTIIFSTCCPNSNTLICKLESVYTWGPILTIYAHGLKRMHPRCVRIHFCMTGKRSARPGAWSKWAVPIHLMSNGCFFMRTINQSDYRIPFL